MASGWKTGVVGDSPNICSHGRLSEPTSSLQGAQSLPGIGVRASLITAQHLLLCGWHLRCSPPSDERQPVILYLLLSYINRKPVMLFSAKTQIHPKKLSFPKWDNPALVFPDWQESLPYGNICLYLKLILVTGLLMSIRWFSRRINGLILAYQLMGNIYLLGFPCWLSDKESACWCRRHGSHPWVGNVPWRKKLATHSSIVSMGNPMKTGAWCSAVHGVTGSDQITKQQTCVCYRPCIYFYDICREKPQLLWMSVLPCDTVLLLNLHWHKANYLHTSLSS